MACIANANESRFSRALRGAPGPAWRPPAGAAVPTVVVALWWVATWSGLAPPFLVPSPATVAVTAGEDAGGDAGCLLYDDRVSAPGRLIVSTLDPFYHHGSHFMPATTRFLDGFLAWTDATFRGRG